MSRTTTTIDADTARYCYLDLDLNGHRSRLARAAAFVHAKDARYGFSSQHLLQLGGSELQRIPDLMASDHEWSSSSSNESNSNTIEIRPPICGNRMVLKLHWEVAPLACENFATLCANGNNTKKGSSSKPNHPAPMGTSGKPLTYRGSPVHRIVPGFVLQGGDFVFGNGSGGESIYNGKKFKDERAGLLRSHNRRGVLSMGNSGKNSNTSQWFLTLADVAAQCDGKHVVFGELVSGWEVLRAAEALGSRSSGAPTAPVTVTDCGVWATTGPSSPQPGAGYWYDQPDPESYTGVSPVFVVRPRVAVVAPTPAVLDKFVQVLRPHHSVGDYACDDSDASALETKHSLSQSLLLCAEGEEAAVAQQLNRLLASHAVDVILVAPACRTATLMAEITVPWREKDGAANGDGSTTIATAPKTIRLDQVVLTVKPVEAASAIRTKSWLAEQSQWQLDGQPQ